MGNRKKAIMGTRPGKRKQYAAAASRNAGRRTSRSSDGKAPPDPAARGPEPRIGVPLRGAAPRRRRGAPIQTLNEQIVNLRSDLLHHVGDGSLPVLHLRIGDSDDLKQLVEVRPGRAAPPGDRVEEQLHVFRRLIWPQEGLGNRWPAWDPPRRLPDHFSQVVRAHVVVEELPGGVGLL